MKKLFTLLTALFLIHGFQPSCTAQAATSNTNFRDLGVTAVVASNDYDPIEYTPIFTGFGDVTNPECFHSRAGKWLRIDCKFTSGTTTATEARISLPSGLTSAGTSLIPSIRKAGTFIQSISSASQLVALIEPSVTYLTFGLQDASNAGLTKKNGDAMFSSATDFSFSAIVPIEGWVTGNAAIGPRSSVEVYDSPGNGSTNTSIKRFSNILVNTGPAITYADSASNGGTFTINENGVYCASYVDYGSGATQHGISKNSTQLTTDYNAINAANQLNGINTTANVPALVSWCGLLVSGDVIRAHNANGGATGDNRIKFVITKVSN